MPSKKSNADAMAAPADNAESTTTIEPRRSGRIAAQPQPPAAASKTTTKTRATKKKSDEGSGGGGNNDEPEAEGSTSKKSKSDEDPVVIESEALSPIDIGDNLPTLVLKDEKGEDVQVADLAVEKGVVLFLVPKADTPGCTTQACGFRDIYPDFTSLDYTVYCLSADTPSAQTKWQTKKELPYPLISDPKRILISALGAAEGGKTKRSHFIFEKGGELVEKVIPVKPADSPKLALEFIKKNQK